MNIKETGSYYTPTFLADFVTQRVFSHFEENSSLTVLEPSVGDGKFLKSIKQLPQSFSINLTAIDIEKQELKKAQNNWNHTDSLFLNVDYLAFDSKHNYNVIIGNPPYIKRHRLSESQLTKCRKIHDAAALSKKSIKNIWTAFLIKSIKLLKDEGVLALILPLELLQVKFTEEIRDFITKEFQKIEIFTFDDLMFECKGQDTIILIAYKKSIEKGIFYRNIKNKSQLGRKNISLKKNKTLVNSRIKWTHHILTSREILFLNKLQNKLRSINDYCYSKPGIVTAANNFFIVNSETEKKYRLQKYTLPIIQKGLFVNGSIVFDKNDYQDLVEAQLPSKFVRFKNQDKDKMSKKVLSYLDIGKEQEIHERYKCKKRENWFVVPNVASQPEGFFLKRSHLYPKLIKNTANAFVTDSAYKIDMKEGFNINSLIYSFYNSLTLTFAEIEGRYYGGGVLELVPSEFKGLPIPYISISVKEFNRFRKTFEKKKSIENILEQNDFHILNSVLDLSKEEIQKISNIRQKLVDKRLRR